MTLVAMEVIKREKNRMWLTRRQTREWSRRRNGWGTMIRNDVVKMCRHEAKNVLRGLTTRKSPPTTTS
jgi:hypothetical protein